MRATLVALVAIAPCMLGGCRSMQGPVETRAYVVRPTPESRSALSQAVEKALDGNQIMIEGDALTRDGVLVVDRPQRRDPTALTAEGRDPAKPGATERFHLVKDGEHCVLIHDRTDRHYELIGTACAPL
ncbi:MAG TPA: hypothetical protein VGD37_10965 [Kofleriaceae bacterium]|jgi:hypothetical protein